VYSRKYSNYLNKMEFITLAHSDLKVSRLCMGGCPLGEYGWGAVDHAELVRTVQAAVDNGITMFDTADVYGLGSSEKTLGQALAEQRKDVVIASKFGVRIENGKTFYEIQGSGLIKRSMPV
jgi:aryl-alcohol dehydrogenase-like predicted oxidoreductase